MPQRQLQLALAFLSVIKSNKVIQELDCRLAFHQQAADELWGDDLGGAGEEGVGEALGEVGVYSLSV